MSSKRINLTLFSNPLQVQQVCNANQDILFELAKVSQMIAEATKVDTVDATNKLAGVHDEDFEMENSEEYQEKIESLFVIELVEAQKTHERTNPGETFDIGKTSAELKGSAKMKARSTKAKNATKPGSKIVGGSNDLAVASGANRK